MMSYQDATKKLGLDEPASIHELKTPLAEWIFIERDICGLSLHEYDPDSEIGDFASSGYGYTFLEDLEEVVCLNALDQQAAALCVDYRARFRQEERQLDKALLLAGVHANSIHADAESFEMPGLTDCWEHREWPCVADV